MLIAVTFALDKNYKLINLDMNPSNSVIWKELSYVKNKTFNYKVQSQKEKEQKNNKQTAKFLQRIFNEQKVNKIPSQLFQNLYQIPDLSMLCDFFNLHKQTNSDNSHTSKEILFSKFKEQSVNK